MKWSIFDFLTNPSFIVEQRPVIPLQLSSFDKFLEKAGVGMIVVLWALTLFALFTLPAIVPIHYNASGKADNHGSKIVLLCLPVLGTFLFLGLTGLNKHPAIFNYVSDITPENAERQYRLATRMLRFLKLAIMVIFTLVILFTYLTTKGKTNGLGGWFLPVVVLVVLIPTGYYIVASLRTR